MSDTELVPPGPLSERPSRKDFVPRYAPRPCYRASYQPREKPVPKPKLPEYPGRLSEARRSKRLRKVFSQREAHARKLDKKRHDNEAARHKALIRRATRPKPVPADARERPCRTCSTPFAPWRDKLGGLHRRYCSPTCEQIIASDEGYITYAASLGIPLDDFYRTPTPASPSRINHRRLRACIERANLAALTNAYIDRTITPHHFRNLTIGSATLAAVTLMTRPELFSPAQTASLRSRISRIVENSLDDVAQALSTDPANARPMTSAQVNLFRTLLGKVVPDLSASYNVNESRRVPADKLSREDLERLAKGDDLQIEVLEPTLRRALPIKPEPTP